MRFFMVALLLIQTGCATLSGGYRERVDCFIVREPSKTPPSRNDYSECRMKTFTPNQFMACMDLKGYDLGECYADTKLPVVKGE